MDFLNTPVLKATWEVVKDFGRWALSFFIGWVLDNGYAFFTGKNLDPTVVAVIGLAFKYGDYYWHRFNKDAGRAGLGQPAGIYPF